MFSFSPETRKRAGNAILILDSTAFRRKKQIPPEKKTKRPNFFSGQSPGNAARRQQVKYADFVDFAGISADRERSIAVSLTRSLCVQ